MKNLEGLKLVTRGEREIVMTRELNAPCRLVFHAFTKPELVKRWLLGPPGWSMPVCEIDLRAGGAYRQVWVNADGRQMEMGGVYGVIVVPERLVATERFDEAWYPGEAVGTLVLSEEGRITRVTQTMSYESREARDVVLKSGIKGGVAASYDRLAEILIALRHERSSHDGSGPSRHERFEALGQCSPASLWAGC